MPLIARVDGTEDYPTFLSTSITRPTFRVLRGQSFFGGDDIDCYEYERCDVITPATNQQSPRRTIVSSDVDRNTTDWQTNMHDRISVEASKWREAVVPNATEVQSVLRQFATYSGMTQQKAYAYVYPLFIYMVFFILAAIMLPPGSCAHHVLVDPLNHEADLAVGFTLLLGSLIMGLILLRLMIWGAALFVGWLIKLEIQGKQRRSRGGSPVIGSLLGGLLTT